MSGTPRRKPGRMGPFVSGFRTSLQEQGYTPSTIRNMLKDVDMLGLWMQEHDRLISELTEAVVAELHDYRVATGRRKIAGVKSFGPLLRFLREEGVIGEPTPSASPVERMLIDYRQWLVAERGPAGWWTFSALAPPCPEFKLVG